MIQDRLDRHMVVLILLEDSFLLEVLISDTISANVSILVISDPGDVQLQLLPRQQCCVSEVLVHPGRCVSACPLVFEGRKYFVEVDI